MVTFGIYCLTRYVTKYRGRQAPQMGPEFKLLHFFMTHQERVTHAVSCLIVWGANSLLKSGRWMFMFVVCARPSVHSYDAMIQTVRGVVTDVY